MDALLAEINRKKADLAVTNGSSGNGDAGPSTSKYLKRAEVEAAQEEAKRLKREQAKEVLRKEKEEREAKRLGVKRPGPVKAPSPSRDTPDSATTTAPAQPALPPAEVSRRLRSRGKPIRFFGETDKDRQARLRALELADGDGRRTGGRVDEFRSMLKGVEDEMLLKDSERAGKKRRLEGASPAPAPENGVEKDGEAGETKEGKVQGYTGLIDLGLLKTDISKLHPQVYWFWKEWEAWLEDRPDDVKRSMEGKLASANWIQSSTNMKPLFKQLRNRTVPLDVLAKLGEIALESQHRQYQKANDAYLRLSIGNAAWPIGVTSVGMHERGARERIATDVVAHVLNDEVSRKWIQAVKRLLTFAQMVRPPKEHAQRMG